MGSGNNFAHDYRGGVREGFFFELGEGFHLSSCWRGGEKLFTKQAQCVSFVKLTVTYPNISAELGTLLYRPLSSLVKC
jgi:hypothetical protein